MTTRALDVKDLEKRVTQMYREVALHPDQAFHFETGRALAERLGYPPSELDAIPAGAIDSYAGVGYFLDLAAIRPGETVAVRRLDDVPRTATKAAGVAIRQLRRARGAVLKVLEVEPGSSVPFHAHAHAHEAVVVAGSGALLLVDRSELLTPGDVFSVDPEVAHGIASHGSETLRVVCMDCIVETTRDCSRPGVESVPSLSRRN